MTLGDLFDLMTNEYRTGDDMIVLMNDYNEDARAPINSRVWWALEKEEVKAIKAGEFELKVWLKED